MQAGGFRGVGNPHYDKTWQSVRSFLQNCWKCWNKYTERDLEFRHWIERKGQVIIIGMEVKEEVFLGFHTEIILCNFKGSKTWSNIEQWF